MKDIKLTYFELLKLFTGDDELRPEFTTLFRAMGKSMATDSKSMLSTPECVTGCIDLSSKIEEVWPMDKNTHAHIPLSDILALTARIPRIEEEIITKEAVECPLCEGGGVVEWEFEGYTKDDDCPRCYGNGDVEKEETEKTGNLIPNPMSVVKVRNTLFNFHQIERLIKVCDALQSDATVDYEDDSKALFIIGEVELLMMGCVNNSNEQIILV